MIEPDPPFELTEGERASALWLRLSAHMEKRRAQLRAKNDDIELSDARTAALRGQIKCLSGLIALGDSRRETAE